MQTFILEMKSLVTSTGVRFRNSLSKYSNAANKLQPHKSHVSCPFHSWQQEGPPPPPKLLGEAIPTPAPLFILFPVLTSILKPGNSLILLRPIPFKLVSSTFWKLICLNSLPVTFSYESVVLPSGPLWWYFTNNSLGTSKGPVKFFMLVILSITKPNNTFWILMKGAVCKSLLNILQQ